MLYDTPCKHTDSLSKIMLSDVETNLVPYRFKPPQAITSMLHALSNLYIKYLNSSRNYQEHLLRSLSSFLPSLATAQLIVSHKVANAHTTHRCGNLHCPLQSKQTFSCSYQDLYNTLSQQLSTQI